MSDFDPIEFGALRAEVTALRREMDDMRKDMKALLALANQSKGGFWMGMTVASVLGGVITWVADQILTR